MKDIKMNKMKDNLNIQSKANQMAQAITQNQKVSSNNKFAGFKRKKKKG